VSKSSAKKGICQQANKTITSQGPAERDPRAEADKVVQALAKIAFANILDFAQFRDGRVVSIDHAKAREVGAKVKIVTRKVGRGKNARLVEETDIQLPDKLGALIKLGKHLGLFETRRKRNPTGDKPVEKTPEQVLESEPERMATPKMASPEAEHEQCPAQEKRDADRKAEVLARMAAARGRENSRPLALLARKEAELREQSAALTTVAKLAARPDPDLLVSQLTAAVNTTSVGGGHKAKKMKEDNLRLYAALESRDAIESIVDRVIIGVSSATMDCIARAASTEQVPARDVNLRYAMKGADTLGNLVKLRDARRGGGQQSVSVGKLKIESGGQAIVGYVNAGKNRAEDETDD
jgi:hypothetical protein